MNGALSPLRKLTQRFANSARLRYSHFVKGKVDETDKGHKAEINAA